MRSLIKLGLLIVVGLLVYNYFWGTPDEKEQSQRIVTKARELGGEAWQLLRSEREKLREGKYDGALDQLEELYSGLRDQAERLQDSEALTELQRLNQRRKELEERLGDRSTTDTRAERELEELTADTEELMHEMETKSQPPAPY
jgi:hypothetical protein